MKKVANINQSFLRQFVTSKFKIQTPRGLASYSNLLVCVYWLYKYADIYVFELDKKIHNMSWH